MVHFQVVVASSHCVLDNHEHFLDGVSATSGYNMDRWKENLTEVVRLNFIRRNFFEFDMETAASTDLLQTKNVHAVMQ